jgi:hypothetical protein
MVFLDYFSEDDGHESGRYIIASITGLSTNPY